MKKILASTLLVLILLATPLYAGTPKTLHLNNMLYEPVHKVVLMNDTHYMSLEDVQAMTYTTYTQNNKELTINLNGKLIQTSLDSRTLKVGNNILTLASPIILIEDTPYVPLQFFTLLNYPYTVDENSLNFTVPTPYSTSTDQYKDHTLVDVAPLELTDLVTSTATTPAEGEQLLKEAIKNNKYLVLPFKSPSNQLLKAMREDLKKALPLEVVIRQGDFLSQTPHLGTFKTFPITPILKDDKVIIHLGDTNLNATFFEVAFNPSAHENVIDSTKTLDAIFMRLLYTYARDQYELKDDVHFSPISSIEMKRSDTMHFPVYLNQVLDSAPADYDMVISKQIHSDRISYIIDFIKK